MTAPRDPSRVGRSDDEMLRRFVACRDAGDADGARRWWDALLEQEFDRLAAFVRLEGSNLRSREEREDALQLALLKALSQLRFSFRGTSRGELVNALRTCAWYACAETQRQAARHAARSAPLDGGAGDDEDVGRLDRELGEILAREHEREQERREAEDFLAWALPRMDERRRLVVRRTLEGVEARRIADELGVGMDNLYQLRSRGLRDLGKLKEQWDG